MDLQTYVKTFIEFLNGIIIPFLIGIAFLLFIVNVLRYFIIGGANTEAQEKAKSLALYGVLAFVVLMIFWGVVNLLASSFGLATYANPSNRIPCADYDTTCGLPPPCPIPGQTPPC